jgi:hypothetical protein
MTIQFSAAVRNAMGNAIEATIGTSPTLEIRTGAPPATCATADSGTVLVTMALPSDWYGAYSAGAGALAGTWQDLSADASGVAAHYRIKQGGTCHEQGTVTATGGGGDLTLNNTNIAIGQQVDITSFGKTMPGA